MLAAAVLCTVQLGRERERKVIRVKAQSVGEVRVAHMGDVHLEDGYFGDTAQCLEWFVCDAVRAGGDLFVINGDLTTYKATIKERNLWTDMLIRMGRRRQESLTVRSTQLYPAQPTK